MTATDQLGNKTTNTYQFHCDQQGRFNGSYVYDDSKWSVYVDRMMRQQVYGRVVEQDALYRCGGIYITLDKLIAYDEAGRLCRITDCDVTNDGFANPGGRINAVLNVNRDDAGHITSVDYTGTSSKTKTLPYTYDEQGNLAVRDNVHSSSKYYYDVTVDAQGRTATEVLTQDWGNTTKTDYTASYTYDLNNRLDTMTVKEIVGLHEREDTYTYHYNEKGEITSVTIAVGDDIYNGQVEKKGHTEEVEFIRNDYCYFNR